MKKKAVKKRPTHKNSWLITVLFARDEFNLVFVNKGGDNPLQLVLSSLHLLRHYNKLWHVLHAAAEEDMLALTLHGEVVNDFVEGDEGRVFVLAYS